MDLKGMVKKVFDRSGAILGYFGHALRPGKSVGPEVAESVI